MSHECLERSQELSRPKLSQIIKHQSNGRCIDRRFHRRAVVQVLVAVQIGIRSMAGKAMLFDQLCVGALPGQRAALTLFRQAKGDQPRTSVIS